MKQSKSFLLYSILLVFLFTSCSKNTDQLVEPQDISRLSSIEAKGLATSLFSSNQPSSSVIIKKSSSLQKRVKNQKTFLDANKQDVFHVINYEEGGFVIFSADRRVMPILAYSEDGNFPLDESTYPLGLQDWIANTKADIKEIRRVNRKLSSNDEKMWSICTLKTTLSHLEVMRSAVEPDDPCQNQYVTIGPLLQTKWGQDYPYNEALAYYGCPYTLYGKPLAGCVAIAMAQVMRYHQYPSQYSWVSMPVGSANIYTYSSATATLIKNIGMAVNMSYGCDGSGTSQSEIASSLISDFGYRSAIDASYNYNTVEQEIRAYRPVILTGYNNKSTNWFTTKYYNGHSWVCDGMSSSYICEAGITTLYLHMNWGWYDSGTAWYAFNGNWNAENTGMTFSYKRRMVYSIKP